MKTIRTILFPTDFSDNSAFAWKHHNTTSLQASMIVQRGAG
jgi:hypothetical protein